MLLPFGPLLLISHFPTLPRDIQVAGYSLARFRVESFPEAQAMAIQLSGIQWTKKEEVLGLSEFAFKSLHSEARMSSEYWDAHGQLEMLPCPGL